MNDDLECFSIVQQTYYQTALQEIKSGQKRNCWRWFVFPHEVGHGYNEIVQYYVIKNMEDYTLSSNSRGFAGGKV